MGYVLGQQDAIGKKEQAIDYLNKKFTNYKKRYSTLDQKAIKGSTLAKHLAYHLVPNYQSLLYEFPNEYVMTVEETESESDGWRLWFNRASNLLGSGIGVVLASPEAQCFPFSARLGFDCTNNMVEYEACTTGVMMTLEHHIKELKVFDDSTLVIYQLRGE
ncbi:hypothetical protein CR513_18397, partial [Mucuna pruriens]